jgi:hypothetical protein
MRDNKRSLDLKVKFSRTDPGMQMYLCKYLKMFDQPWASTSRFPSGASRGILVERPGLVW